MNPSPFKPRVGLVLGSGSARGWAHIGVIRALEEAGLKPDIVCGTSIGALVGAAYMVDRLDAFESWVLELGLREVVSFMDFRLNGGMLKGERLVAFFKRHMQDCRIEDLPRPFGAVATSLHSGAEIWIRNGSLVEAVRASIALPGLFSPIWREGHLLVDGGLVNPVPVSLARAMGADVLIAVDLNTDLLGRHLRKSPEPDSRTAVGNEWIRRVQQNLSAFLPESEPPAPRMPSMIDVVATSLNIMQVRITRSRMVGEPPDFIIAPRLSQLNLLDFHRGKESIAAGHAAVQACLPGLRALGLALTK